MDEADPKWFLGSSAHLFAHPDPHSVCKRKKLKPITGLIIFRSTASSSKTPSILTQTVSLPLNNSHKLTWQEQSQYSRTTQSMNTAWIYNNNQLCSYILSPLSIVIIMKFVQTSREIIHLTW
ncbi:hypothetical protein PSTG_19626, partial [Puccinia striiformis f. sp. tritici PST-78]